MNTKTEEIINGKELEKLKEAMGELHTEDVEIKEEFKDFVKVKDIELTRKQKRLMKVSMHDNRSRLGIKFTNARKRR